DLVPAEVDRDVLGVDPRPEVEGVDDCSAHEGSFLYVEDDWVGGACVVGGGMVLTRGRPRARPRCRSRLSMAAHPSLSAYPGRRCRIRSVKFSAVLASLSDPVARSSSSVDTVSVAHTRLDPIAPEG